MWVMGGNPRYPDVSVGNNIISYNEWLMAQKLNIGLHVVGEAA